MPDSTLQETKARLTLWLLLFTGQCFCGTGQCQTTATPPPIEGKTPFTPFTPETNFMSSVGFYRWQHFQRTGQWPNYEEADSSGDWSYDKPNLIARLSEMMNRNPGARRLLIFWGHEYITSESGPGSVHGEERYYPSEGVLYSYGRPVKRISPERMQQLALRWKELWPENPVPKKETEAEIRMRLEMYLKARRQWLTEWNAE